MTHTAPHQPEVPAAEPNVWREKIYRALIFVTCVFGVIAYVPSVLLSIEAKLYFIAAIDTVALILAFVWAFAKGIPYRVRTCGLLGMFYLLGVVLIPMTGPYGAGVLWLFAFPLVASVLLSMRATVVALIINALTLALFAVLHARGVMISGALPSYPLSSWVVISANFVCLNALTAIPTAVLVQGLEKAIASLNAVKEELREEQKELIKAKTKAEELSRLKTNFLANISHEVRTPLNGIIGLIDVIDDEIRDERLQSYTKLMRESSDKLLSTITAIIRISQKEAEGQSIEPVEVEPDAITNTVVELLRVVAEKKSLTLRFKPSGSGEKMLVDPEVFRQIMHNLIGNAIKFTEKGEIQVESALQIHPSGRRFLCTKVIDTGIGIAADFQQKIFLPFEQESTGYDRKFGGSGLGLAIVRKYVELFGGKVTFSSKKGEGSVFEVCFPCCVK